MISIASFSVIVGSIYLLSVITEYFFIPSLDQISDKWHLPPNVSGASLMAMGSSAPELSIALLALFKEGGAHSDVGVGTIVGSAVFNILVITGVSAIFREARIKMPAIVRDTVFYLISIVLLLVVFSDGSITMGECLLFLGVYAAYLVILFTMPGSDHPAPESEEISPEPDEPPPSALNAILIRGMERVAGKPEQHYLRAFGVSILFIIILSWILVDMAVIFAGSIGMPPVVIALTVLAAGTSAPDLISSVVVAKQGRGDMAVANAIGSNIFDILIGLGLPWLVVLTLFGRPFVSVGTNDLLLSVFILMATVVMLFIFLYTDRRLTKREGWALLLSYAIYVVWTILRS